MSLTTQQAVDEMLTLFQTAWDTTGHQVIYPDVPLSEYQQKLIDGADGVDIEPWARITVRHGRRRQRTFGHSANSRLYDSMGVVFIEVYTPMGTGLTQAYTLAELVRNAFEGISTPNGVWFRDVQIRESGSEGLWSSLQVTAEFEYQERK